MADQKISELNAITGVNTADDDLFVIVDTSTNETKKITKSELQATINNALIDGAPDTLDTLNELAAALADDSNFATTVTNSLAGKVDTSGDSMTGNLTFGDNDKAIFGAGSDLNIYHNGSHSYIRETGTGNLFIQGVNVILEDPDGNNYFSGIDGGSAYIYHNGSQKLATTSTGIDVTGTATMDGLTVNGGTSNTVATLSSTDIGANLTLSDSFQTGQLSSTGAVFSIDADPSNLYASTKLRLSTDGTKRVDIDSNGDISFYEDTGTTAKFFWDASAESLGIGTSSPSTALDVAGAIRGSEFNLDGYGAVDWTGSTMRIGGYNASQWTTLTAHTGGIERMRIDSAGNVGIGTSSISPWRNEYNVLELGGSFGSYVNQKDAKTLGISSNLYIDAGGSKYATTGNATRYYQGSGNHVWETAASGTAGNAVTLSERMRIDSSGNVGINASSPTSGYKLDVKGNIILSAANPEIRFNNGGAWLDNGGVANTLRVNTSGIERMRIDSSGNLLAGKTTADAGASVGVEATASGKTYLTRDSASTTASVLDVNKKTGDGTIIAIRKDGSTVGSIGVGYGADLTVGSGDTGLRFVSGIDAITPHNLATNANRDAAIDLGYSSIRYKDLYLSGGVELTNGGILSTGRPVFYSDNGSTGCGIYANTTNILPTNRAAVLTDNAFDLGSSGYRWDDIYATNGTIQTSDRNEKQDIDVLSDAEQRVAQACKGLLRKFRWKDSVAEKGDDARIHFGIIAQDLQAALEAEGLDAGKYAMFISTTWWETTEEVPAVEAVEATYDEEGNVLTEAVEAKEAYTRTYTYETAEEAPEGAVERTRLGVRYPELLAFIIATL